MDEYRVVLPGIRSVATIHSREEGFELQLPTGVDPALLPTDFVITERDSDGRARAFIVHRRQGRRVRLRSYVTEHGLCVGVQFLILK